MLPQGPLLAPLPRLSWGPLWNPALPENGAPLPRLKDAGFGGMAPWGLLMGDVLVLGGGELDSGVAHATLYGLGGISVPPRVMAYYFAPLATNERAWDIWSRVLCACLAWQGSTRKEPGGGD